MTMAEAFKNRPITSKKRPNKQRLAIKREAIKAAAGPAAGFA
jgi:hypothetical protein